MLALSPIPSLPIGIVIEYLLPTLERTAILTISTMDQEPNVIFDVCGPGT